MPPPDDTFGLGARPTPNAAGSPLREALCSGQWYASLARELTVIVGSIDALELLDTEPLPDESFDWTTVLDRDRAFVEEVLSATDRCCDERLDTEYRTIVRRLLALVASHDARPLRRRITPTRFAAALVWLALQGNGDINRRGGLRAQDIWWWFQVTSCASLGRGALAAAGLGFTDDDGLAFSGLPRGQLVLGDVRVLHSRFRSKLVARRTQTEGMVERAAVQCAASRPIIDVGAGKVELRARPVEVLWTLKAMSTAGRAQVIVALGESEDDPELLSLTVPQAHELRASLQHALDASLLAPRRH